VPAPGPLDGIRVLDLTQIVAGPVCGRVLADLGADVVKVESPAGDMARAVPPIVDGVGALYAHMNAGKRSACIDIRAPGGAELVAGLAERSDVLLENFRPAALNGRGLGYDQLRMRNPRLVYCSISGFGSSGPYVNRPSYDSVAQALSGFLSVVVDRSRPRFLGPALADAITGLYASYGVLGALVQRGRTTRGCTVEVSMLEAMAHFAVEPFAAYFDLGVVPTSTDRPQLAQAYILRTADGRLIALHLSSLEKFWTGLVAALEAPALAVDRRFVTREARIAHYETLAGELNSLFAQRPLAVWAERLGRNDVPFAPVNSIDEVIEDPQVGHLGLIVPVQQAHRAARAVRPPVQFAGRRAASVRAAPLLDEHGTAIRRRLGAERRWPDLDLAPVA